RHARAHARPVQLPPQPLLRALRRGGRRRDRAAVPGLPAAPPGAARRRAQSRGRASSKRPDQRRRDERRPARPRPRGRAPRRLVTVAGAPQCESSYRAVCEPHTDWYALLIPLNDDINPFIYSHPVEPEDVIDRDAETRKLL